MDNLNNYALLSDPLNSFVNWHAEALALEQNADAMSVATYDFIHKRPVNRYLLYKGLKDQKIIFYTNYQSPKSKDLDHSPEVALNFYWHNSKRQVRIQGRAIKMRREDSENYFHSRDRESQIASYCSAQSSFIQDKEALVNQYNKVKAEFEGKVIPLPQNWGGFLVDAYEYEFFIYGANRLNDRFLYELKNGVWSVARIQP